MPTMHVKKTWPGDNRATILIAVVMLAAHVFAAEPASEPAFAPVEKVLHSFSGAPDGANPTSSLVADAAGNLYGTSTLGGTDSACDCGTVFELSPPAVASGSWTETVLYSFKGGNGDGKIPKGTLTFDKSGNLYGTTEEGGPDNPGTVFELTPPATHGAAWTEKVLFFFPSSGSGGRWPPGNLIFDGKGNLYGTTVSGGAIQGCICGTVFELTPPATKGGTWTESLLYTFGSVAHDGLQPGPGIVLRSGALYGTTQIGGANQVGTVFELAQNAGIWTETILYSFAGETGGSVPAGGLIFDTAGNLYGTVRSGGNPNSVCLEGCGLVFELSPPTTSGNPWEETALYTFNGSTDGGTPLGGVVHDTVGNLYGTAAAGGAEGSAGNNGVVFKLTRPAVAGGTWTETVLHAFGGSSIGDGRLPAAGLINLAGKFYGTTYQGGTADNLGTVFRVVP
jgi:uncharacterized repeat protein (TIGR03803 family)